MSTNSLGKTSCISVVLLLLGLLTLAQPVANFSANPVSGCAPQVVNFTDQSTGAPTQWKWDLGNGTISFLQNPSVTYFSPGQYTVKLVAQNASGVDSIVRIDYITIYAQPTVNFLASTLSGCFPLPVQFTDISNPGSGTITQWEWDFGDGNISTQQNPAHTYTAAGNYNVSLRITNSNGCFKTLTRLQYIQISNGVNAVFTNSVPSSCSPPVNISFQNLSTGTGALTYAWNFGDGNTSNLPAPSHNYTSPGSYTVQLIVTNSTGCSDTLITPNAITIGSVNADFTMANSVCVNTLVSFPNTSAPAPVGAFWDFGDGTTSILLNPVKVYSTPGTYFVKLVSNFGACTDSATKIILVLPKPSSAFTASPIAACQAPLTVNFNNTSSGAVSQVWNFGDGITSTAVSPTHTYTTPGSFTVALITTNASGCSDTLVRQEYINLALPQVTINNLPEDGCAPLPILFSSTVVSNEPVATYAWDFGDGTTSTLANPVHAFAAGVYDIQLIITTASGCTDTAFVPAGVKAGVKPVANFNANPTNVCANTPVNFFDLSSGTIDAWQWDFGDGSTSEEQHPVHVYEDTGYFDVQLIVMHNGCRDTLLMSNYIHIDPPIAIFNIVLDCGQPGRRIFTDASIGADTWSWDFGDGNSSIAQNPVHNYTTPGTYMVTLTVTNNQTGCSFVTMHETQVVIETADFNATDTVICRNSTTSLYVTASSSNITAHQWLFGDGATASGDTVSHVYTASGVYTVSLITTDINGCIDTIVKPDYILVNGPVANFTLPNPGTCSMSAVQITDNSTTDGIHPISTWEWNYGDGINDTLQSGPFQHVYTSPGVYTISVKVTDTKGCTDSIVKISVLTISQPVANFVTADTSSCPGRPVSFSNLSFGPGLNFNWNFGDGNTSTGPNPTHTYAADGIYTVKLDIVDQFGCTNTITRINYIVISTPHANFTASDTLRTCPTLVVNFTNSSSNYTNLNWDFGDGTSSQLPNPTHFYSTPGIYMATLTVNGPAGCSSVKTQRIVLRGPQGTFTYGGLSGCDSLTVNFVAITQDSVSFIWDFNDGSTLSTNQSVISHTYTTPGVYIPKMILLDTSGCMVPVTGIDTIRVNGATAGYNFTTQTLCDSGSVQFNNTSTSVDAIAAYSWNFGDGSISTASSPTHFYSSPGLYYPQLTVTTASGCVNVVTNTLPVKIVASPQGQILQSPNGCAPLTVSFNGTAAADTSAFSWNWILGNGHTSTLQNPAAEIYANAGNYPVTLYLTNSSGCIDTITSTVNTFLVPTVSAGLDTTICQGNGTMLQASGAATYTWNSAPGLSCYNCANPIATPDSLTQYFVTGTTAQGCSNRDSVFVSVHHPFNMLSSASDTLCVGSSTKLQASGAYTYKWSPAAGLNNPNIANPNASPNTTTVYQVIGTDSKGCFTDTAYVPIKVYPIPVVEAGSDVTINVGQMIDLVPVVSADVTMVTWSPTGSIFRSNYPAITVNPQQTTTYQVAAVNGGGCRSVDNLTVHVICNGANVFIPNTFSPNGDGANDVFYPRGTGLFSIKTAKVFNRWGEVVYQRNNFQANDVTSGWDGSYKGVKLNPDVYVYIIEILCGNSTVLPFKGNVALLR